MHDHCVNRNGNEAVQPPKFRITANKRQEILQKAAAGINFVFPSREPILKNHTGRRFALRENL